MSSNNSNKTDQRVLIICPYSAPSACGIWVRVLSDAKALQKAGCEVHVFSSNIIKGTNQTSGDYEEIEGIKIHRFKVKFKLGGTSMFWFFYKKLKEINPDIIHTHGYRHPHSLQSLIIGKLLKKKVFITTHGPFEKDKNRSTFMKLIDFLYDKIFWGWWELKSYNKVIRIADWEISFLKQFGVKNSILIPNGIKSSFYNNVKAKDNPTKRLFYMGRIDAVKRIEWIIDAAKALPEYQFMIKGPIQYPGYTKRAVGNETEISNIQFLDSNLPNLFIENTKYSPEEFIHEADQSDIFLLSSTRESFSQVAIEAMSRGVVVISSNTKGPNEFIKTGINGFIVNTADEMIEAIKAIYVNWNEYLKISQNAIETAKNFNEEITTKKLIELYSSVS
jgi:glycosyltransferase involved in cell wall biosynthesis